MDIVSQVNITQLYNQLLFIFWLNFNFRTTKNLMEWISWDLQMFLPWISRCPVKNQRFQSTPAVIIPSQVVERPSSCHQFAIVPSDVQPWVQQTLTNIELEMQLWKLFVLFKGEVYGSFVTGGPDNDREEFRPLDKRSDGQPWDCFF
jgi:hypothetical protein